jgi:solute carrier family 35 protein F5
MPLWFLAQWSFNASLALTSVTSNTILSSTSSLFTFFLSILLLGEVFSSSKLLAIMACIVGTALVTLSDATSQSEGSKQASLSGDALTVISTALYAGYTGK